MLRTTSRTLCGMMTTHKAVLIVVLLLVNNGSTIYGFARNNLLSHTRKTCQTPQSTPITTALLQSLQRELGADSHPAKQFKAKAIENTSSITSSSTAPLSALNRRQMLKFGSSLALATSMTAAIRPLPALSSSVSAETVTQSNTGTTSSSRNLDCLLDLPPVPKDYCRIFLCRHGQTENNRLRLVQGSRLDPPINDVGKQQAECMGLALARASPSPSFPFYHSPLKRAQQTAENAALAAASASGGKSSSSSSLLQPLNALMEVDFGPVAEGQPINEAKPGMMATYARWALGDIDYTPEGGGDSGRDVSRTYLL